jgi:ribosomal RNA assembly protein
MNNMVDMDQENDNNIFGQLEMVENVKVPLARIGVIIGKKGTVKKLLEGKTQTKITVASEDGMVSIRPDKSIEDPTMVWIARDIIKAIGRGFSEEKAFKLLDPDYYLDIVTLDIENKSRLKQIRGSVIGEGGRTSKIIEKSTKSYYCPVIQDQIPFFVNL